MSRAFLERTDRLVHDVLEWAVAGVLLAIAVICFAEVVLRYGLGRSFGWYDEFIGYLLVWLTFLATVLAHQHGQHIGIDNALKRLPHWAQRFAGLFNHAVMAVIHIVLLVYGTQLVSRLLGERAITLPIPMGLVYLVLPASAVLMLVIEAIHVLRFLQGPLESD